MRRLELKRRLGGNRKTRVATGGRKSDVTKSIGVSLILKAKTVRKSGAGRFSEKGKKTLNYGSDDFSSSSNDTDTTPKATMGGPSIKKLLKKIEEKDKIISTLELELKKIEEKDKIIMSLKLELSTSKVTTRMTKAKVREELRWTGEETNFADSVNHFCRHFLFPIFSTV